MHLTKIQKNIMKAILKYFKNITIIYISHRPIKGVFKKRNKNCINLFIDILFIKDCLKKFL